MKVMKFTLQSDDSLVFHNGEDKAVRFRKQILKYGTFKHPQSDESITLDAEIFDAIIHAFVNGAVDNVPIIMDTHEESAYNTVGRVIGLEKDAEGLFAIMEIADSEVTSKIETKLSDGKGIIDEVSVSIAPLQKDDGSEYPVALLHVAIVPHAWFREMQSFERLAASINMEEQKLEEKNNDTVDLIALLREEGISVESIQEVKDLIAKAAAVDTLKDDLKESKEELTAVKASVESKEVTLESLQAKIEERDKKFVELYAAYKQDKGEVAVDKLVEQGKIVPANRDYFVSLYTQDEDLFNNITANLTASVELGQSGLNAGVEDNVVSTGEELDVEAEFKRITEQYINTEVK